MEETKIIIERITRIDEKQQSIVNQLDTDRRDIDQLRIDMSTIKEQLTALSNQFTDNKKDVRQIIQDTISVELPKIVKKEIRLLAIKNPKKQVKGRAGVIEWLKLLFKNKNERNNKRVH